MWFESSAFKLQCAYQFPRELVKMQIDSGLGGAGKFAFQFL